MNSLKSLILVIIAGILLTRCNQSDVEPEFLEVNEFIDPQSDAVLSDLLLNFSGNDPSARFSDQLFNEAIGQILTNRIVKRISSPDQIGPVYSMPVVKDPHDNIKEWLVLEATENGYVGYIIQYEHEGSFDLLNFTGTARVLDLERTIQSEEYFENGVQTSIESENGRTETTYTNCDCHWETRESDVIGPITGEPIGTDEEVWLVCYCDEDENIDAGDSMTGGGDSGIGTPIEGGSGPTGGGDGGSGGSGGTIGLPSECEESGGLSGSDGTCASESDLWEIEKIDDSQLKPCMQSIMNDLKSLTQGVGQIIAKFAGNTPGYNWEVKDGSLSSGGTASTSPLYNHNTGTVTTTFDSQAWKQATELSWARTILHESIHAYLVAWDKNNSFSTKMTTYPQLMQDYFSGINANTAQHQEMARSFVQDLADALEEYGIKNGYSLGRQFYEDMSWAGLQGTSYFSNLPSSDKNRILNVNSIELTGKNLQGITKTQKGKNAGC